MNTLHIIKTVLACGHLLAVACAAADLRPSRTEGALQQCVVLYGWYSGSNNGYGFFAPSVGSRWQARFSLYDEHGHGWTEESMRPGNREVNLRHATILGMFARAELREVLAASWAARMFARHPEARLINVHVQIYRVPPMRDFSKGDRPEWVTVAVYSFGHNVEAVFAKE